MEQKPYGIGIIGAGNIVKRHAQAYISLPESARLVGVADIDRKRAEKAKSEFRFDAAFDDYHQLLARDDIQVVDLCTPANHHAPMVVDALKAGKHVLCEKPMATTLAEADDIIRVADEHPQQVASFVFQLRSDPTHRRIRRMIEQGLIGRPLVASVSVRLRKKPSYFTSSAGRGSWKTDGGGVLINQAIHQLDALVSFLGDPVAVSAVMDAFVQPIEAEDTITGWVKFSSGAFATIECTLCAQGKSFLIEILGENAALAIGGNPDANKFDLKIKAQGSAARQALETQGKKASPAAPADPASWKMGIQKVAAKIGGRPWKPPGHWGHTPFVREFLTAIETGSTGPIPPREGRRSLELAAALYESALTQSVVRLPLDSTSRVYNGVDPANIDRDVAGPIPGDLKATKHADQRVASPAT